MKFSAKVKNSLNKAIAKLNVSSLAQDEVKAQGDAKAFSNIGEYIDFASQESIVLLKNDGVLPLKNVNISILGRSQIDYFYVGYGSGGDVKPPYKINFLQGLDRLKCQYNKNLSAIYKEWIINNPVNHGFWGHWPFFYPEMPISQDILKENCKNNDVCIVIIGRAAGEDRENKLEKGSYYLTDEENNILDCATSYFQKVVVVMNVANIIDMSWVEKYDSKISAILYAWQGGMESGLSLAKIITGVTSPSGKLPDTIAKKYEFYPSADNFGNKIYNNYAEDIFVGYRYFNTFAQEKVLYPFGFGLSYTTFSTIIEEFLVEENSIKIAVMVKNIGDYKGKEVVQVYAKQPQTKLTKANKILVSFGKTKELEPNESQTLYFEVSKYSLSSFDDDNTTDNQYCYILEKGQYEFSIGHSLLDTLTCGVFDNEKNIILEQLEEVCPIKEDFLRLTNIDGEKEYKLVKKTSLDLKQRIIDNLPLAVGFKGDLGYKLCDVAENKCTLENFISQLNNEELFCLTRGESMMNSSLGVKGNAGAFGGYTQSLQEKGILPIITTDGPAGVRVAYYTSLLPCGVALASTFNLELVEKLTTILGEELAFKGSDMLLAPGMNIHRDVLCGRNFEYFSEDPHLTGKMASAFVVGIQKSGKSACPKHFACNNQETNRNRNDSRLSQRALREIYLKGFEICVKDSHPLSIMTSYNKINGVWGHYSYDLATQILRKEWGYDSLVITDWWMKKSKSPEFSALKNNEYRIRSQVDVLMPGVVSKLEFKYKPDKSLLKKVDNGGLTRGELERTAKNVLEFIIKIKLK